MLMRRHRTWRCPGSLSARPLPPRRPAARHRRFRQPSTRSGRERLRSCGSRPRGPKSSGLLLWRLPRRWLSAAGRLVEPSQAPAATTPGQCLRLPTGTRLRGPRAPLLVPLRPRGTSRTASGTVPFNLLFPAAACLVSPDSGPMRSARPVLYLLLVSWHRCEYALPASPDCVQLLRTCELRSLETMNTMLRRSLGEASLPSAGRAPPDPPFRSAGAVVECRPLCRPKSIWGLRAPTVAHDFVRSLSPTASAGPDTYAQIPSWAADPGTAPSSAAGYSRRPGGTPLGGGSVANTPAGRLASDLAQRVQVCSLPD